MIKSIRSLLDIEAFSAHLYSAMIDLPLNVKIYIELTREECLKFCDKDFMDKVNSDFILHTSSYDFVIKLKD